MLLDSGVCAISRGEEQKTGSEASSLSSSSSASVGDDEVLLLLLLEGEVAEVGARKVKVEGCWRGVLSSTL